MTGSNWPPLPAPDKMAQARDEMQNAAQWLARMTSSYGTNGRASGTPELVWDGATRRIVTPEVAPGTVLGLSLPDLSLQFTEGGQLSPHAIDVDGKSSTEVEAWLLCELLHRGFDRDSFSKHLPYSWDGLMSGDEAKYAPQDHLAELQQLTDLLENAATVLSRVRTAVGSSGPAPVGPADGLDMTCWPDSFDIGLDLPLFAEMDGAKMRVGFSLGSDGIGAAPAFFVRSTQAAPLVLPVAEIVRETMTLDGVVGELLAMMKKARKAAAN